MSFQQIDDIDFLKVQELSVFILAYNTQSALSLLIFKRKNRT